nr:8353_t:CDS:2 [Entrophospora candida]
MPVKLPDFVRVIIQNEKGKLLEAAKREVFEETNLAVEDLEIVAEQAFGAKKNQHCMGYLVKVNKYSGEIEIKEPEKITNIQFKRIDYEFAINRLFFALALELDIDGTSTEADFSTLNKNLKKVLEKLKEQGHKICFTTGRNYLSALPFYDKVGLDTFLVTYNGAYINNPSDKDNKEIVAFHTIRNNVVRDILNEPVIKQNIKNVLIDHVNGLKEDGKIDLKTISTSDDIYYQEIFFNGNPYTKGENILQLLGKKDVLQLVLEFPKDEKTFNEILVALQQKYNNAITYYFGSKLKAKNPGDKILVPDPERKIIKIRNELASKGMGAE